MSKLESVQIGNAILFHGDCRNVFGDIKSVDAVITDPPYGVVNRDSAGLRNLDKGAADVATLSDDEIIKISTLGQSVYLWCGTEQVSLFRASLVREGYSTRLCIWEKTNPSPMNGQHMWLSALETCVFGRRSGAHFSEFCKPPVFKGPSELSQVHPTQKPVWLMKTLVVASVPLGGTVLDPFMGSGTTGVAAIQLGRRFIGIEQDKKFFDIACERIAAAVAQPDLFLRAEESEPEPMKQETLF